MSLKSSIKTVVTLGKGVIQGLPEAAEDRDPIELFGDWFHAAGESGLLLAESCALATADADGMPSVRMVLLKAFDARGFVFYTNYASKKAIDLEENPRAALCFHWPILERQVRIAGPVARISEEESVAYFATRTRGSRIGAWASKQSQTLPDRATLEGRVDKYKAEYPSDVPLPPFWGGYRLAAQRIEFWQGKADRLHERLAFTKDGDGWGAERLYP